MRWSRYILGKCAKPAVGEIPEHVISRQKLRDVSAYRRNPPRDVSTKDLVHWLAQPCREPAHKQLASQEKAVTGIWGRRMGLDEDVISPSVGAATSLSFSTSGDLYVVYTIFERTYILVVRSCIQVVLPNA